eukprot:35_1
MKQACVDDRMVYIDVYDPLEQDADFEHMIRGRNLFVFVYSITNQYTFEEIEILIEKVYTTKEEQSWFGVVCGNKCDLEDQRQISKQQGQEFVNKHQNLKFYETSAKYKINNVELFYDCVRWYFYARDLYKQMKQREQKEKGLKRCMIL